MWNIQADESGRIMWTASVCRHTRTPRCTVMMNWNRKTLSPIQLCYSHANENQMYSTLPALDSGRKTNNFIIIVFFIRMLIILSQAT